MIEEVRSARILSGTVKKIGRNLTVEESLARLHTRLSSWKLVHLKIHATATESLNVPFPGSLLRGAFGAALYQLVCVKKGIPCRE